MIGKLIGHRQVETTARYAHSARDSVKTLAERVSDSLAVDLDSLDRCGHDGICDTPLDRR